MALLLSSPASISLSSSPRALSKATPSKLPRLLPTNPRSNSILISKLVTRSTSQDQEPVKVLDEEPQDEPDEKDYELTEVEKSLAKVFKSRLWFVFLFAFLFGMYAYFITAGNGASYIPMMRYQYNYQR